MIKILLIFFILLIFQRTCIAEHCQINIAIASNFLYTAKLITKKFEQHNKCKILISSDSTSNLFTKIQNDAPFNIFISADKLHAKLIEKNNFYKNKSQMYAIGSLVIIKNNKIIIKNLLKHIITHRNMTLSNPLLSPYGSSSSAALKNLKINYKKTTVLGSNINQTFNFIINNTCDIGLAALSQVINKEFDKNSYWKIPKYLYPKIKQHLILIKNESKNKMSNFFIKKIKKKDIKNLLTFHGYKNK